MEKRIAAVQSNYIPWKGYFDLINSVDEFILLDDAQYTRRDWRNRNRIKTPQGIRWLTIPVTAKGRYLQRIDATEISDPAWADRHLTTLAHAYGRSRHFKRYLPYFERLYANASHMLSQVNRAFLETICEMLGIDTKLSWSADYPSALTKDERLVSLCQETGARHYLSGPTARGRLDERVFAEAGISVSYFDYSDYPIYDQLHPPFVHDVSIVDLLFNVGPDAHQYMKSFSVSPTAPTPDR